jgi:hypothetical protein
MQDINILKVWNYTIIPTDAEKNFEKYSLPFSTQRMIYIRQVHSASGEWDY